jgi:Arc/MetJ-type ribon-helix-helix transcriptional regulator
MEGKLKERIQARFPRYVVWKIERFVESGLFRGKSDFMRTAADLLIAKVDKEQEPEQ